MKVLRLRKCSPGLIVCGIVCDRKSITSLARDRRVSAPIVLLENPNGFGSWPLHPHCWCLAPLQQVCLFGCPLSTYLLLWNRRMEDCCGLLAGRLSMPETRFKSATSCAQRGGSAACSLWLTDRVSKCVHNPR